MTGIIVKTTIEGIDNVEKLYGKFRGTLGYYVLILMDPRSLAVDTDNFQFLFYYRPNLRRVVRNGIDYVMDTSEIATNHTFEEFPIKGDISYLNKFCRNVFSSGYPFRSYTIHLNKDHRGLTISELAEDILGKMGKLNKSIGSIWSHGVTLNMMMKRFESQFIINQTECGKLIDAQFMEILKGLGSITNYNIDGQAGIIVETTIEEIDNVGKIYEEFGEALGNLSSILMDPRSLVDDTDNFRFLFYYLPHLRRHVLNEIDHVIKTSYFVVNRIEQFPIQGDISYLENLCRDGFTYSSHTTVLRVETMAVLLGFASDWLIRTIIFLME